MRRRRMTLTFILLVFTLAGLAAYFALSERQAAEPPPPGRTAENAPPDASADEGRGASDEASESPQPDNDESTRPEPEPPAEGELIAVGDIMMHMPQLPAYYDKERNVYDFSPYFTAVAPILSQGDWVMANLETTLNADGDYTGYPMFSA